METVRDMGLWSSVFFISGYWNAYVLTRVCICSQLCSVTIRFVVIAMISLYVWMYIKYIRFGHGLDCCPGYGNECEFANLPICISLSILF